MIIHEFHIRRFKGIDDIHIKNLGDVNAFYGRNNSGKSTILQAIDMAGIAFTLRHWDFVQLKHDIKDLFPKRGPFEIVLTYFDGKEVTVQQYPHENGASTPIFKPEAPTEEQKFKSIYIMPDPGLGMHQRRSQTPKNIMKQVQQQNFSNISGNEILFALKYYAKEKKEGFIDRDYDKIITDIKYFFPEIKKIISKRTEDDIATLSYSEYGRWLDILYTGSGLKHFIDIFVKVALSQASVVLIDEPEMGVHPSLQREMLSYFHELVQTKGVQFFLATHSPIFLSDPNKVRAFCMQNRGGERTAFPLLQEKIHMIWGDLGIRPSDLLQNDIVVLVEGQDDVIFFEHVIYELYQEEFKNVAIGVVQYAGDAALGIISGKINVSNIVPGTTYRLWIRDRDARPDEKPDANSTKFLNALKKHDEICHILDQREIEFYYSEAVHVAAQQGDSAKESAIREILHGKQNKKFRDLASGCTVPRGSNLKKLIREHLSKKNLDPEIKKIVEKTLIPWRNDILGIS